MANKFNSVKLTNGTNQINLHVQPSLAVDYDITYPESAPADGQVMVWDQTANKFVWGESGTSVSLTFTAPPMFNVSGSPYTGGAGSISLSLVNQVKNLVLASPIANDGTPVFRALTNADLPNIDATKVTGLLAKSNIPNGTNATDFQINASGDGIVVESDANEVKVYADSSKVEYANLYCKNLIVSESIDQDQVTTVNLGDSILNLNANFTTGTPTQNAGFQVTRGDQPNSELLWNESTDKFVAGVIGSLKTISRQSQVAITNSDIVNDVYVFSHNLNNSFPKIIVSTNNNEEINVGITYTNANTCSINFEYLVPITGTWNILAIG